MPPSFMSRDQVIDRLALMLAGLQVPLSMSQQLGVEVLGQAEQPYRELLQDSGFGWRNDYDFRVYLERTLREDNDV